MTIDPGVLMVVVLIPLVIVWAVVMIDIARQPRMSGAAHPPLAALCTLIWPMLIVYWMTRPTRGRLEVPEGRTDPSARLVRAALAHESGLIDDSAMTSLVRELRGG